MRLFFCNYIISFTFERGTPALQLKEHVMGQAVELAHRCIFLVFVQKCTKCVPTYFFLIRTRYCLTETWSCRVQVEPCTEWR